MCKTVHSIMAALCSAVLLVGVMLPLAPTAYAASPYAGQQRREIKALSAQRVEGLLAGRGLGYAKAAELNHYPGPAHALELAERLRLDPEQRHETQRLFDTMQAEARALGERIVALEQELDALFAQETIDEARLSDLTTRIGTLEGRLRAVHLRTHLRMRELLSPHQVRLYDRLRGYVNDGGDAPARPDGMNHGAHHGS